jgi:adenine/guanine phosphoribosyltransferase-like PRPP-binding protein
VSERDHYSVEINGLERELPLFEVAPGLRIAVFNLLGDTEVVEAAAAGLANRLDGVEHDVLVTAETKSVPLLYELARRLDKPWVVLRKAYKPYMGDALSAETHSITTGAPQTLYLDEKDRPLVQGRRVVLVDDVISTGSTVEGMRRLVADAAGEVVAEAAVFTEGERPPSDDVLTLGHLPLFRAEPRAG